MKMKARARMPTQKEPIPENFRCSICGGKKEIATEDICYSCHLNEIMDDKCKWYPNAERYTFPNASNLIRNATRKPKTGLDIFDCPSGAKLDEVFRIQRVI